jgi:hypothetical protein
MELVEILYRISPLPSYDLWDKREFESILNGLAAELGKQGYGLAYRRMNEKIVQFSAMNDEQRGEIIPKNARKYLLSKGMEIKKIRKIKNLEPEEPLLITLKLNRKKKTMLIETDPDEKGCCLIVPYDAPYRSSI